MEVTRTRDRVTISTATRVGIKDSNNRIIGETSSNKEDGIISSRAVGAIISKDRATGETKAPLGVITNNRETGVIINNNKETGATIREPGVITRIRIKEGLGELATKLAGATTKAKDKTIITGELPQATQPGELKVKTTITIIGGHLISGDYYKINSTLWNKTIINYC